MIYYIIALVIIVMDMITKWIIVSQMELGETVRVIGDFFTITSHRNEGAAFGILQGQRWFFIVFTTIVLIGLLWYLRRTAKEGKILLPVALAMVLGGAVGNFIDRASTGKVVDFLQFHFEAINYTYPIFNIADCGIVIGVGLILLDALRDWNKERKADVQHGADGI